MDVPPGIVGPVPIRVGCLFDQYSVRVRFICIRFVFGFVLGLYWVRARSVLVPYSFWIRFLYGPYSVVFGLCSSLFGSCSVRVWSVIGSCSTVVRPVFCSVWFPFDAMRSVAR